MKWIYGPSPPYDGNEKEAISKDTLQIFLNGNIWSHH
jgi:hypothetical protein